jgi:hypothetical protein
MARNELIWLRIGTDVGSLSTLSWSFGAIKCWEFVDILGRNYQLLKDPAPYV